MNADMPATPAMSVIVPTRDRPGPLAACLDALDAQVDVSFEIVVVDDGSRDAAAVATVVERHARARLVTGEGRGPAAARNAGARAARAEVVSFTDDDCRPVPGWLSGIAAAFDGGAEIVAGPTVVVPGDAVVAAAQTVTNHLLDRSRAPDGSSIGFAPTSNLACRATVLEHVPFDERYPLAAGEDRDWCARVADRGIAIDFAPDATVVHDPRLSFADFWRQQVRYGRGARHFHRSRTGTQGMQPLSFYLALVRRGFAPGATTGMLVLVSQVATGVGYARAVLAER